jgi:hypothetical protein
MAMPWDGSLRSRERSIEKAIQLQTRFTRGDACPSDPFPRRRERGAVVSLAPERGFGASARVLFDKPAQVKGAAAQPRANRRNEVRK